jgi:hypothetical protein
MIGIDIGLPTVFIFSPLIGELGQWLLKATITLGAAVLLSHIVTRIIKAFL